VRAYILDELKKAGVPDSAVTVDRLGNVLVHITGEKRPKHKVMFSAHLDEVALMVTELNGDGTLSFGAVGGISAAAVIGRQVLVGSDQIHGVIGTKPVHHLSKAERTQPADFSALYCDIGTASREKTAALVSPGDIIYFDTEPMTFGDGSYAAKAIDDRFGCLILLVLIRKYAENAEYDTDFAFVVQEEVGLRGAGVAANAVQPEIAVIFEATTAADLPDSHGTERVCELGNGAVISFIDGRTIYDKALYDHATACCEKNGIPWQTKKKIAGGNDAGAIQHAGNGVRVLAVSVPCRYLHAPVSVIRLSDAEACERLAELLMLTLRSDFEGEL
jgi:endoglucanase